MTSDTAKRPPGLSTRNASRSTASLSVDRLMTQFEMTTSTELSGSGMCSIVPLRNSTFVAPALRWFSRASASISSVMSRPYALPVGPTRLAESRTSMPPPDPRSSTVWPGSQREQGGRVAAAERGGDGVGREAAGFGVGVEIRRDRVAAAARCRRAATGLARRRRDRGGDGAVLLANRLLDV